MATIKRVTLNQPRKCKKCKATLLAGTAAIKDSRDPRQGRVYYCTECKEV